MRSRLHCERRSPRGTWFSRTVGRSSRTTNSDTTWKSGCRRVRKRSCRAWRDRGLNIELLSARADEEQDQLVATLFVPQDSGDRIIRKVEAYRTREDSRSGRPRNERLVTRMETARLAELRSIYVADQGSFPPPHQEAWWEVWLRSGRRDAPPRQPELWRSRFGPTSSRFQVGEVRVGSGDARAAICAHA